MTASNILAYVIIGLTAGLPLLMTCFYLKNVQKWKSEEFRKKYGTLIDDANLNASPKYQWIVFLVPISFLLRRMIFSLTMIYWIDFFWG